MAGQNEDFIYLWVRTTKDLIMFRTFALTLIFAPTLGFAAGSPEPAAPEPTQTTTVCEEGYIFDEATQACAELQQDSFLDDDSAYEVVRELAYAGRYLDAQMLLASMDQADDRVQTYWGFTHRKMGNMDAAMTAYHQALSTNPDNILARSYMGQAFVTEGEVHLAYAQLQEINTRGGTGTWAAQSLETAIRTGVTYNY